MVRLALILLSVVVGCSPATDSTAGLRTTCDIACRDECLDPAQTLACVDACVDESESAVRAFNQCDRGALTCDAARVCASDHLFVDVSENTSMSNDVPNNQGTNNTPTNNTTGQTNNANNTSTNNTPTNNTPNNANNVVPCDGEGEMTCGGDCVYVLNDNTNCGACDKTCFSGRFCNDGVCGCQGNEECAANEYCDFLEGSFVCLEGTRGSVQFGDACDTNRSDCELGICLNYCTHSCESEIDCPQGYNCSDASWCQLD